MVEIYFYAPTRLHGVVLHGDNFTFHYFYLITEILGESLNRTLLAQDMVQ
jgi:hypothetical protein